MSIGNNIKRRRIELGLSVDELAKKIDKNRATVYRYENNDIENLPITILGPLARALDTTPADLMGWDVLREKGIQPLLKGRKIPILGTICAGDGIFCDENYEGYFIADPEIKRADFVVKVEGDSMSGDKIQDGDMAFLRSTHTVDNGRIAAVLLKTTNEVMLKRVYVKEDHAILQPSNPTYSPITTDNFLILGELVGIYHKVE